MVKKLPSSVEDSPDWVSDDQALEEDKFWTDENKLTQQKNINKIWLMKTIGWIAPAVMIIFSLVFIASFVSWAWHFIMPECYQWLTDKQLSKIQSIIFSGAMGAIVSSYLKKQID